MSKNKGLGDHRNFWHRLPYMWCFLNRFQLRRQEWPSKITRRNPCFLYRQHLGICSSGLIRRINKAVRQCRAVYVNKKLQEHAEDPRYCLSEVLQDEHKRSLASFVRWHRCNAIDFADPFRGCIYRDTKLQEIGKYQASYRLSSLLFRSSWHQFNDGLHPLVLL